MDDKTFESSLRLAEASHESAQARIAFIDTKVGVAVTLLAIFLPAPLIFVGWLTGLEGTLSRQLLQSSRSCPLLTFVVAAAFTAGMVCGAKSVLTGIACLRPRAPKGHGETGWSGGNFTPNTLFPIYTPATADVVIKHLSALQTGVDRDFVLRQYVDQLVQLGRILNEKMADMRACFTWMRWLLIAYALGVICTGAVVAYAYFHG